MKNILFVCTGNICRSPMAVGLMMHYIEKNRDSLSDISLCQIASAGICAGNGFPASSKAIDSMDEIGIDIRNHRSRTLTNELVNESKFIFVMTNIHKLEVLNFIHKKGIFVKLIGEFYPRGGNIEIPDPIGKPLEDYRNCRDNMQICIPGIIKFINSYYQK